MGAILAVALVRKRTEVPIKGYTRYFVFIYAVMISWKSKQKHHNIAQKRCREDNSIMPVLGMLALSAADSGGMRPMLLTLLLVAITLLFAGGIIALLTLRSQRKANEIPLDSAQLESERI